MIDYYAESELVILSSGRNVKIKRLGLKYIFLFSVYLAGAEKPENYINALKYVEIFIHKKLNEFKRDEIKEIIEYILDFNIIKKPRNEEIKRENLSIEELNEVHDYYLAIIAEKTGWTDRYISEKISLPQAQRLIDQWNKTRVERLNDQSMASCAPYGADLIAHTNAILGIKEVNLNEFMEVMDKRMSQPV